MAVDMFLKIETIEGESVDDKHKGWIDVLSFSWGVSAFAKGNAPAGKVSPSRQTQVSDFSIVKYLDTASPALFSKSCEGDHVGDLNFVVARKGDRPQEFYIVKMSDCLISSVAPAGGVGGGSDPMEQVSFSFASATMTALDSTGQLTSATSCGSAGLDVFEKQR